jgi:LPS sulfotransferase NodH
MPPHHIPLSYQACRDFPRREEAPVQSYMVATSPRSGSTYFCLLLWRSGVLGAPMEYLNFKSSGGIVERLGGGSITDYWGELRRLRTSPNGVFGFKIFVGNYVQTLKIHPDLVPHIQSDRVIYLRRLDKIAQAVSHLKAIQSGSWFAGIGARAETKYDFTELLRCYRWAKHQDFLWEKLFSLTASEPLRLTYEEVVENPSSAVERVCSYLGVAGDSHAQLNHISLTEPQADSLSQEWADRFAEELSERLTSQAEQPVKERIAA